MKISKQVQKDWNMTKVGKKLQSWIDLIENETVLDNIEFEVENIIVQTQRQTIEEAIEIAKCLRNTIQTNILDPYIQEKINKLFDLHIGDIKNIPKFKENKATCHYY